jgi:starvation-inducible outer membrane lipoprotein
MKFIMPFLIVAALGLSACQSQPVTDKAIIDSVAADTKKEQEKKQNNEANPAKCQQAKLDLVEVESSQDIPQINQVKAAIMRYCDNIQ